MIVAAIGVVGVIAVIGAGSHDDHRDHSNHRNYPDSSLRDEIAKLEAEIDDYQRSVNRFNNNNGHAAIHEFFDFVRSNPELSKKVEEKLGTCWNNTNASLDDLKKTMKNISSVMVKELETDINKEKKRLQSIDETLRRINNIELNQNGH